MTTDDPGTAAAGWTALGCWVHLVRGKNLQVLKADALDSPTPQAELAVSSDKLLVGCGHGTSLQISELQLEGKKRTSAHDFIQGYRPKPGERLG